MKVSIIVPIYNTSKYLKESIESLANQNYNDFEILLIDDYSTDTSAEIADKLTKDFTNIVFKSNTRSKGISSATNTGIEISQGEYIVLADSDDLSLPNRIQKQVDFMDRHSEIGASGTWMKEFDGGNNTWKFPTSDNELKALCILHSPICNPTAIIRKSILDTYKIRYDENIKVAQDYNLWLKMFEFTKFANIPEVLVKYRIHKNSVSNSRAKDDYESWKQSLSLLIDSSTMRLKDEDFSILYNLRYPNFLRNYPDKLPDAKTLLDKIRIANNVKHIFPVQELSRLFKDKLAI